MIWMLITFTILLLMSHHEYMLLPNSDNRRIWSGITAMICDNELTHQIVTLRHDLWWLNTTGSDLWSSVFPKIGGIHIDVLVGRSLSNHARFLKLALCDTESKLFALFESRRNVNRMSESQARLSKWSRSAIRWERDAFERQDTRAGIFMRKDHCKAEWTNHIA